MLQKQSNNNQEHLLGAESLIQIERSGITTNTTTSTWEGHIPFARKYKSNIYACDYFEYKRTIHLQG